MHAQAHTAEPEYRPDESRREREGAVRAAVQAVTGETVAGEGDDALAQSQQATFDRYRRPRRARC